MMKKKSNGLIERENDYIQIVGVENTLGSLNINLGEGFAKVEDQVTIGLWTQKQGIVWKSMVSKEDIRTGFLLLKYSLVFESEIKIGQRFDICVEINEKLYFLQNKEILYKSKSGRQDLYNKCHLYLESSFLNEVKEMDAIATPYYNLKEGLLRILFQEEKNEAKEKHAAHLKKASVKGSVMHLKASLDLEGYAIKNVYLRYRSKVEVLICPMEYSAKLTGNSRVDIRASIDLKNVPFKQLYWDGYILLEKDGKTFEIKLKHRAKKLRLKFFFFDTSYHTDDGHVAFPYFAKDGGLVLNYREQSKYDGMNTRIKEALVLATFYLLKPYWKKKKIWLVYEKFCLMAQDNGYYFFQYCMENLPESEKKSIYYIIDKNAPDYENVKQYGKQVIQFMSFKHCLYYKAATLFISSDTKNHGYAWRSKFSILKSTVRNTKICFLQHGVTAFKRVHPLFGKTGSSPMTYFVATSKYEQDIIYQNFGYELDEIPLTGFTRWDVLEDKKDTKDKQILLMPTWRSWIEEVADDVFVQSDYFKNYMALLNNEELILSLEKKKVRLVFYIHPKFRDYMSHFQVHNPYVTLIPFGQEPLNELMMKCSMLITDYSSVAWDVYYLGKPVVFYQFDYEKYDVTHGSYMDMTKELFGERTDNLEELVSVLKEYIDTDFEEKEIYNNMRDNYFAYCDNDNSKRTYEFLKKKER